jgi:hypothetical protein
VGGTKYEWSCPPHDIGRFTDQRDGKRKCRGTEGVAAGSSSLDRAGHVAATGGVRKQRAYGVLEGFYMSSERCMGEMWDEISIQCKLTHM